MSYDRLVSRVYLAYYIQYGRQSLVLLAIDGVSELAQCLFKVRHIYIFNILKKDFKLQRMLKPGVLTVWNVYPIAGTIFRHS